MANAWKKWRTKSEMDNQYSRMMTHNMRANFLREQHYLYKATKGKQGTNFWFPNARANRHLRKASEAGYKHQQASKKLQAYHEIDRQNRERKHAEKLFKREQRRLAKANKNNKIVFQKPAGGGNGGSGKSKGGTMSRSAAASIAAKARWAGRSRKSK